MDFSIIPFPLLTDDVMQWLMSSDLTISAEMQEGNYPTIRDFLTATNSNHKFDLDSKPNFYELELHVTSRDMFVDFIVTVTNQKVTDLQFRGELDVVVTLMRRLTSKYGSFLVLSNGEPVEVICN